jgi:hypothetical protein
MKLSGVLNNFCIPGAANENASFASSAAKAANWPCTVFLTAKVFSSIICACAAVSTKKPMNMTIKDLLNKKDKLNTIDFLKNIVTSNSDIGNQYA